MPVGSASTGKTFSKVISPPRRLSSATPLDERGLELMTETKSQQPSGEEMVLKGWPGSGTKETGSFIGALHCAARPCRACAAAAQKSKSAAAPASLNAVC